ncbi:MAG: DUF2236 domain-containing protein [Myxococcales bacterium]|nr:DUF2236 domain-containing protein [Myxococcales bacterium]
MMGSGAAARSSTSSARLVTRDELEAALARLDDEIARPEAGIFGPDTAVWHVSRESIVFLGAGRAMLLQLAHPYVAYAIDQHSNTRADPLARFRRTFDNIFAMFFDDLPKAKRSARRVHTVHTHITGHLGERIGIYRRGQRYRANEVEALLWVYATLIDTALMTYEMFVEELSSEMRERYYRESFRFAALFGLGEDVLPPDFAAFRAYFEATVNSGAVVVSQPGREIGRFLLRPRHVALRPSALWFRALTGTMLPETLREAFGLPGKSRVTQSLVRLSQRLLRWSYARLSPDLRVLPAMLEAEQRLGVRGELSARHRRIRGAVIALLERALALVGKEGVGRERAST